MAFDPDKYLSENTAPSQEFDPDVYLSKNAPKEEGFMGASFIEPALAVGSSLATLAAGGLAGIVQGAYPFDEEGAAAERVKDIKSMAFKPSTEEGKEGLETFGQLMKFGVDVARIPISGIAGIAKLISSGFDVEETADLIKSIQGQGLGKEMGEATFEATEGAPIPLRAILSTGAEILPDVALALSGFGGAKKIAQEAPAVARGGRELVRDIKNIQSPAKRDIARQIQAGEVSSDIAKYKLAGPAPTQPPTARQVAIGADAPKVVKDTLTKKASYQGFGEGFLDAIKKKATKSDLEDMLKMTDMSRKGKKDPFYGDKNPPASVAGDVLAKKINEIKSINRKAGKNIGSAEKYLKGKTVPASNIGDSFKAALKDLKVKIDGKDLNFDQSIVAGAGRRSAIKDIWKRMVENKNPDALDLHELKQYIDETVSYGKTVRGLGGKAEGALKEVRTNIKEALDINFPDYAKANKVYSDTISALDEIQSLAGKKTDLTGSGAGSQLSMLARRVTSHAASRESVRASFNRIDEVLESTKGYGDALKIGADTARPPADLYKLMKYADELDKVTGSAASTSLAGSIETVNKASEISRAAQGGLGGALIMGGEKVVKKIAGINQEGAYKSMREFLKEELKSR